MTLVTLLMWAIVCLFGAFVAWGGVRKAKSGGLSFLALLCVGFLSYSAYQSLGLLNLSMQSYALGVPQPANVPTSIWSLGSLAVVWKFAPLWMLGR